MKTVVTFFALTYLISWSIWLPLYLPYFGYHLPVTIPYNHAMGALGPIIVAFFMTHATQGKRGVKQLIASLFNFSNPLLFSIALFSPFVLLMLAALISYLFTNTTVSLASIGSTREFPEFTVVSYLFYNLFFFGFGEEGGWKGFALPRLQVKFNALLSSLVFTFFWAVWHLPLFFYRPGYTSMDFGGVTGWFLSLATGSILLTWLYNSTKGSIFICALFHATIDMAFVSDNVNNTITQFLGMLITLWGIATIIVFKPGNLSRNPRVTIGNDF